MPLTDIGNQSTYVSGSPLRRRRLLEQPDPARQQAFAQEGLRRRSALRARGVPGIPDPSRPLSSPLSASLQSPLQAGMLSGLPMAPEGVRGVPVQLRNSAPAYQRPLSQPVVATPQLGVSTPAYSLRDAARDREMAGIQSQANGLAQQSAFRRAGQTQQLAQFDMQQAQQNLAGRLNAARTLNYGGGYSMMGQPAAGTYSIADNRLSRTQRPTAPELPVDAQLAGRVDAALGGSPLAQVPLEQQGFVASQLRRPLSQPQQPTMASAPATSLQAHAAAKAQQPAMASVPTYGGLAGYRPQLGNPWYDPAPQVPANQPNAYGLQAQRNFVPAETAPVGTGVLGTIGNSTVHRIDGKNVVIGNTVPGARAPMPGLEQPAALSTLRRQAEDRFSKSPQLQANAEFLRTQNEPRLARESALRQAAQDRRLAQYGAQPMKNDGGGLGGLSLGRPGTAHRGPTLTRDGVPLPSKATGVADFDMQRQADEAAESANVLTDAGDIGGLFSLAGIKAPNLNEANSGQVVDAWDRLRSQNISREGQRAFREAVGHFLHAKRKDIESRHQDVLTAIANGDEKKIAAYFKHQAKQGNAAFQNRQYFSPR